MPEIHVPSRQPNVWSVFHEGGVTEPVGRPPAHQAARGREDDRARAIAKALDALRQPGDGGQRYGEHDRRVFEPCQVGSERLVPLPLWRGELKRFLVLLDRSFEIANAKDHQTDSAVSRRRGLAGRVDAVFARGEMAIVESQKRPERTRPDLSGFPGDRNAIRARAAAWFGSAGRTRFGGVDREGARPRIVA